MSAIVHGWNELVEKDPQTVQCQIAINKLWIPDVLIDIIKDFLYMNAEDVRRKYYKSIINGSISRMHAFYPTFYSDMYERKRYADWAIGHIDEYLGVQLQGTACLICGDPGHFHINGLCCILEGDHEEEFELFELYLQHAPIYPEEVEVEDTIIPEVTWEVDVP